MPDLRILDQEHWDRAKARQQAQQHQMTAAPHGQALNQAHRRVFLLSGLLACGCCGGGYTIMGRNRYGCATRRGKGTCSNSATITRQTVERRVLGGLRDRMLTQKLIETFVRTFEAELASLEKAKLSRRRMAADKLADVHRRLRAVLRAIENGAWSDSLQSRLTELEPSKTTLTQEPATADQPIPVVRLLPNAPALYRDMVADMEASLSAPEIKLEAAEALCGLIDRVTLTPDPAAADGLRIELQGALATILAVASGSGSPNEKLPRTSVLRNQLLVVARTGFKPVLRNDFISWRPLVAHSPRGLQCQSDDAQGLGNTLGNNRRWRSKLQQKHAFGEFYWRRGCLSQCRE
nr:zinc ribbon domain-containing protein [uncultured Lichenicoccus sp.]